MEKVRELEKKLEELTGLDFEVAQKNFRVRNKEYFGVPQLSTEFQAEIAALALKTNVNELKGLPLKQYSQICNKVQSFLYASEEDETAADK